MSEHLITPRKSRWESFRDWCKSWSPQVKQGVISGAIVLVLTVAGWLWHSTKGSSNVTRNANIAATNVSGPVVLVQGNENTLTVPQNASETASEKGVPPSKEAQAAKVHAMSEPLITPRKSSWDSFRDWCTSWSPQVKQGVISSAILVVLTVAGWLLHSAKRSSNVTKNANIAATNVSGPVVLVQGNGNSLTMPQNVSETASEKGVPPSKEAQAVIDWVRTQARAEYEKLLKEAKEESRIPLEELHRIKSESEARARAAEGLPGFIFFSVIEIRDVKADRRKYLFDFGKMDQERLSIYISKDGIFTLCLNDARGEPHLVQVPLGKDGVPISTRFHLGCEVGVGVSSTFLRLLVDGNDKGSVTLPFKIDLGKLDSNNGFVGTDLNHKNGSWFDLHMDTVFTVILTKEERTRYFAACDNLLKGVPDKPYLRFNGDQFMIFGNLQNPNTVIPDDSKHKPEFVKP